MPKACPYAMMKSQRLKHFFGGLFYLGFLGGRNVLFLWGGFLGDFITLWVVFFLRNLIFYDEYETCGFDFCADGGGAAVGGSK